MNHLRQTTVAIMTKVPEAGRVKTRMLPALAPEQAARLHDIFLRYLDHRLSRMPWARRLMFFDPPHADVRRLPRDGAELVPQAPGDLTARLVAATAHARGAARARVLFLGADSPDVPVSHLSGAVELLHAQDVVLGPTEDGGYWCLGVSPDVHLASLLAEIDWSSGREFAQTLARARSLGYNVGIAGPWDDVDRPEDLRRLVSRLGASNDAEDRELLRSLDFLPDWVRSP